MSLQTENLVGQYIFSPVMDNRTTHLNPRIHFLAFPRELIISVVVTLRTEGKELPGSRAALQLSAKKYNSAPVSKPLRFGHWLFSNFFLLPLKSKHVFDPFFSAVPALTRVNARVCTIKMPRLLPGRAEAEACF